jgi:type I site-specific restriction endonuclease
VKPIECVFFLRNVKSAGFFEQMKGRGVRVISPDKLRVVSPTARVKDRFIIVDAVGVCEQDKTDSHTLNRQPSKTLEQVLEYVAQGGIDPEALTTLAGRLARLQREFSTAQLTELRDLAGGKSFSDLAQALLNACDPDAQREPIQHSDFNEFIECYKPGREYERAETWSEANPDGRWRRYDYEDLLKRDKLSLDLFWIKDKSLTDTDSLPAPGIIAAEIADDLEAALEQFTKIATRLK